MDHDRQARVIAARLSLTASLPWMPPPDVRTRQEAQTGTTTAPIADPPPSDIMVSLDEATVARQALEDELVAQAEEMLAAQVPQDQPWAQIGLTLLIIMILLGGDDEDAPGIAGWLPRWYRRRRDQGLETRRPTPRELAEALRGHLSSYATAQFNGLQHAAISAAARRDPQLKMMWATRHDARVRDSHRFADGQVQPVGGLFRVGAAMLPFPGFPGGPPEETWGCRCVLLPTKD